MKVYDFFSGCGGTSAGLRAAGAEIVFALDLDKSSGESFHANFPEASIVCKDIRAVHTDALKSLFTPDCITLFCGCAPCQPFSKQNQKSNHTTDPRADLLIEFGRFVRRWRPDYVLIENVPGLQKVLNAKGPLNTFRAGLEKVGYFISEGILSCFDFGVPQRRDRFILLASRWSLVPLPQATHGTFGDLLPPTTVRDWISQLPPLEAGETDPDDFDHSAAKLSPLNLERIKLTPEGGGREAWPLNLQLACHREHRGHSDVYGRMSWDKPAASLTTRCISYSNGRFGHPSQARAISVREAACLQTFDKAYRFIGSLESKGRQIGNAVPPLMAEALGRHIMQHAQQHAVPSGSKRRANYSPGT